MLQRDPHVGGDLKLAQVDVPTPYLIVKRHRCVQFSLHWSLCLQETHTSSQAPWSLPFAALWPSMASSSRGGQCPTVGWPLPQSSSIRTWEGRSLTITNHSHVHCGCFHPVSTCMGASIGLLLSVMGGTLTDPDG